MYMPGQKSRTVQPGRVPALAVPDGEASTVKVDNGRHL